MDHHRNDLGEMTIQTIQFLCKIEGGNFNEEEKKIIMEFTRSFAEVGYTSGCLILMKDSIDEELLAMLLDLSRRIGEFKEKCRDIKLPIRQIQFSTF